MSVGVLGAFAGLLIRSFLPAVTWAGLGLMAGGGLLLVRQVDALHASDLGAVSAAGASDVAADVVAAGGT